MRWFLGFEVVGQNLCAEAFARSSSVTGKVAAIIQLDEVSVRIAFAEVGDSVSAVGRCLETLWTVFEELDISSVIHRARVGTDVDCMELVRDLEAARHAMSEPYSILEISAG